MTYREHLIRKAECYWATGQSVPTDTFAALMAEGVDVQSLETQLKQESI